MYTQAFLGGYTIAKHEDGPTKLRQRAEEARRKLLPASDNLSPDAIQKMLHELQVHQIELELQNEEMRRAQDELLAARR
jgi:precorrin-6B methylase 1